MMNAQAIGRRALLKLIGMAPAAAVVRPEAAVNAFLSGNQLGALHGTIADAGCFDPTIPRWSEMLVRVAKGMIDDREMLDLAEDAEQRVMRGHVDRRFAHLRSVSGQFLARKNYESAFRMLYALRVGSAQRDVHAHGLSQLAGLVQETPRRDEE